MNKIPLVDLKANYLSIKNEIDTAIKKIVENTNFIMGDSVLNFEEKFSDVTKSKNCVCVNNGTSSIFLALKAVGVGLGDEVITVPNTFIATTEAISLLGAKIKFVDVEKGNYLMNADLLEGEITKKTKAIVPVHLYGQMANMKHIKEIADKHDLKIVEDAAQAHLAEFDSKQPGYYGDIATYSFFPAKNLGCFGDGGAITTNNNEYAKKISMLRDHGRISKYEHLIEGFNFRMDSLQAAILSVKLKYLNSWTEKRRENAKIYDNLLSDIVCIPKEELGRKHVYYTYQITINKRDKLKKYLESRGISCGIYFPIPLHLQKAYNWMRLGQGKFPIAEDSCKKLLAIPMYPELESDQIEYICKNIEEGVKNVI